VSTEKTLVLVKPDGVARGLVGEVIARIEAKGYKISALRMLQADRALLERHYAEHQGKPFFEPLVEFMILVLSSLSLQKAIESSKGFVLLQVSQIQQLLHPAPSVVI